MTHRPATWISSLALSLLLPALAAWGQMGAPVDSQTPVFKETDPYEKPDRKEPSMWHRPHADTPAAQFARAAKFEQEHRISAAISAYDALVHKWHNSAETVVAQQKLARLLEENGQYEDAFFEYQYLITYFSGQFPFLDALDHQYRCANALCTGDHKILGLSTKSMSDVRRMFERLLLNGPNWAKAPEVGMRIGELHESEGEEMEAVAAYEQVQNRFPGTDAAHDAAYRAATCRCHFALTHPRDAQSRDNAVAALNAFLRRYPTDPMTKSLQESLKDLERQTVEASFAQAVFYDRNRHDRTAAIAAYRDFQRRFPDAPQAKEAAARLLILERSATAAPAQGAAHEAVR